MKIVVFNPKQEFTLGQLKALAGLGSVTYTKNRTELPLSTLLRMAESADILCPDPDTVGGFEKGKKVLRKILENTPSIKGVCLSTTSYGWIDLDYCKQHGIIVSNIPHYSRESVAEHTIALLFCLAKKILKLDRKTQKGEYQLEKGTELKGKTLGIIGLGSIGSRTAELGNAIGMKVVAYNRSPKEQKDIKLKSLKGVLKESDAISIHLIDCKETENFIGEKEIDLMKNGVMIVNTAERKIVDEKALAKAIKAGKVGSYAFETEDLEHGPLAGLENVIGLKGFGWYTKEALANLFAIWVENIRAAAKGRSRNRMA